jgi:hypothetical protein
VVAGWQSWSVSRTPLPAISVAVIRVIKAAIEATKAVQWQFYVKRCNPGAIMIIAENKINRNSSHTVYVCLDRTLASGALTVNHFCRLIDRAICAFPIESEEICYRWRHFSWENSPVGLIKKRYESLIA